MWTLNVRGKLLTIDRPVIMGILNRTQDSFYSGSRVADDDALMRQASTLVADGADWLDIGGQSTRPGAETVGEEEELRRVVGAIGRLRQEWPEVIRCRWTPGMPG